MPRQMSGEGETGGSMPAGESRAVPQRTIRGRWVWLFVLVFVPAIWGYNWVVMKEGLAYAGPFEFAAWRFMLGAVVLFAAMALTRRPFRVPAWGTVIAIGLLQTAGNTGFAMWALLGGPAGRSAILSYAMPFWVLLMAWPLLGERPRRLQGVATLLAMLGIALVFISSTAHRRADAALYAILAGVTWAAGTVLSRRLLTRRSCDPLALTTWQMLAGGLGLWLAALLVPGRPTHWTPTFALILAYEVLPATAMAWLLWIALLGRVEASVASLAILASPLIGLLSSAIQLGERPAPLEAIGMLLILGALALVGPVALRQARGNRRGPATLGSR